jgi:hypothetical protein
LISLFSNFHFLGSGSVISLILRLRGGMMHESSGRRDFLQIPWPMPGNDEEKGVSDEDSEGETRSDDDESDGSVEQFLANLFEDDEMNSDEEEDSDEEQNQGGFSLTSLFEN